MICSMCQGTIFEKIKSFSSNGFQGIEIKVATKQLSLCDKDIITISKAKDIKKCLDDYNMQVVSTYKLNGWFELDGDLMGVNDDWNEIFDECKRRIEISKILGSKYIITCPALSNRNHHASLFDGSNRYYHLWNFGKSMGVFPVIEFMGQTKQINTLDKCIQFVELFGNIQETGMKIIVDTYHLWRGGGNLFEISKIDCQDIAIIHLADANPQINRLEHKDIDRPMIGDGFFDLKSFVKKTEKYSGFYSVGSYSYKDLSCDIVAPLVFKKLKNIFN